MESAPFFIPPTSFCSPSSWFASSCTSPHHSHHLRSHHLSLPLPFTVHLKLSSFANPFIHSHSYSFWTVFTDLNLYCIKGALAFVCFSFFFSGYNIRVLDKTEYSAFESTLNPSIVSYRILHDSLTEYRSISIFCTPQNC